MNSSMDWGLIRAFLATAQTGSYSAAARQLKLTQPTLGRQVAALEAALGLALFERAGRGVQLTDAGRDLLPDAQKMGEAAQHIEMLAQGRAHALEGTIKLTASDLMSVYTLPDVLLRLRAMAPGLRIDVVAANDITDILAREADIAIRHVRPTEPDLVARFVRDASAHFYASRRYVAARGEPNSLEDLKDHDFISLGPDAQNQQWMQDAGYPIPLEAYRISANSGLAVWELVRQGFGLFPMSDDIAEGDPDFVRLLDGVVDLSFPVWLVTHRDLHTSRRIRLVFDFLVDVLKGQWIKSP